MKLYTMQPIMQFPNSPLPLQSTVPMPSLNLPPSHSPVDQFQAAGLAVADDLDLSLCPMPPIQLSFTGPSCIVDKGKGKDPAENPRSSQLKRKAAAISLADQPCHMMHLDPVFTRAYAKAEEADACHH